MSKNQAKPRFISISARIAHIIHQAESSESPYLEVSNYLFAQYAHASGRLVALDIGLLYWHYLAVRIGSVMWPLTHSSQTRLGRGFSSCLNKAGLMNTIRESDELVYDEIYVAVKPNGSLPVNSLVRKYSMLNQRGAAICDPLQLALLLTHLNKD